MRILLTSYWSYPSTGAIEIYLRLISSKLREAGHRVDILARNGWDELRLVEAGKSINLRTIWPLVIPGFMDHFSRFPTPSRWVLSREQEHYIYEIGAMALCDFGDYDLIHAQDVYCARAMARIAPEKPLVTSAHGLAAFEWLVEGWISGGESLEWRYVFLTELLGLQPSDVVIVPGNWMKYEYTELFGAAGEKITVLPHGIDVGDFDRRMKVKPENVPDLDGRAVVTCVARLVPLKGHQYLLQAIARLRQSVPNVVCLVVGDGPLLRSLQGAAESLGLKGAVHFLGRRDDVPSLLARSDVVAVPSLQEVTPLAIMEAQLAGKPVVATDVGGIPDMIDDMETGILVPPADDEALAGGLERVLNDKLLRWKLSARGRARVIRERTWEDHLGVLEAAYHRAVRSRGR